MPVVRAHLGQPPRRLVTQTELWGLRVARKEFKKGSVCNSHSEARQFKGRAAAMKLHLAVGSPASPACKLQGTEHKHDLRGKRR